MRIARVIGTVVATQKDERLIGSKLLLVRDIDLDSFQPTGAPMVAVDTVGAGAGETVLIVTGSSARLTQATRDTPVDAAVIGIIDEIKRDSRADSWFKQPE